LAGTIPAILLFIPIIQILFVGLTVSSSALVMIAVALLFGLLVPSAKSYFEYEQVAAAGSFDRHLPGLSGQRHFDFSFVDASHTEAG